MIPVILLVAIAFIGMLLPHLPGRYDASAATLSFVIQAASYSSLLMMPVGLAWIVTPRHARLWNGLTWVVAGLVVMVIALSAVAVNHMAMGVILGIGVFIPLRLLRRQVQAEIERTEGVRHRLALYLTVVPLLLVTFVATVLPRASAWSRDRAIQHSADLIAEIEAFRQRRGHYPVSLQSLNRDVPTGVVGIERFHYEPTGETYNVFFVRPAIALGAHEVVIFNPRDEQRFTSHELDVLQYDGAQLDLRRGDRRRTALVQPHWVSILFD
ncbi:MAG: hypothetical protein KJ070_19970 [Verrucomicrobia bacterium]|nr:hypothetical protein [Verrucomicrobiota bacterium]